jgi:streptomycin 6-kinase
MNPALPERLRLQFLGLVGERVNPWLDALPTLVGRLCEQWDLELQGTLEGGWSSYVAFGTRRGDPVVLKIAPKPAEGRAEIAGLLLRRGVGVPPMLCHDFPAAALLVPRLQPGTPVQTGELDAGRIAALLRGLHIALQTGPPHITLLSEQLAGRWRQQTRSNRGLVTPLADTMVAAAAQSARRLSESASCPVLLHGDFEARNILHGRQGLVAIDSPAVVGDPGYDAASWVLSEGGGSADALGVRVRQLAAAFGYPEQRIWAWAWPLAVDSLITKLHEPGWPAARINEAFALTRLITGIAAPSWHDALN